MIEKFWRTEEMRLAAWRGYAACSPLNLFVNLIYICFKILLVFNLVFMIVNYLLCRTVLFRISRPWERKMCSIPRFWRRSNHALRTRCYPDFNWLSAIWTSWRSVEEFANLVHCCKTTSMIQWSKDAWFQEAREWMMRHLELLISLGQGIDEGFDESWSIVFWTSAQLLFPCMYCILL